MIKGILFMALAAALWGLAFLAPLDMGDIAASDITLGRFLVFGISSLIILAFTKYSTLMHLSRRDWAIVFLLGISGNLLYFFFMTLGVQYAGPTVTALIIGTLPLVLPLVGNWRQKSVSFKRLVWPLLLTA